MKRVTFNDGMWGSKKVSDSKPAHSSLAANNFDCKSCIIRLATGGANQYFIENSEKSKLAHRSILKLSK